jgi:hypothetical protein
MYCLSIRNPLSYLICAGVKDVENRTWTTKFRGRILIHSSGDLKAHCLQWHDLPAEFVKQRKDGKKGPLFSALDNLTKRIDAHYKVNGAKEFNELMDNAAELKNRDAFFLNMAIIGEVTILDIVKNSKSVFAEKNCFHWILTDPVLYDYDEICYPVHGKLGLWKHEEVHHG